MKISFLIMDIRSGGAEKVLTVLVNGLARLGHDTAVICLNPDRSSHFFPLDPSVRVLGLTDWNRGGNKLLRDANRVHAVGRILKQEKPDVLVSFLSNMNIYGAWAGRLWGVPHIACERNSPWHKPEHPRKRKKRDLAFAISRGCVFQTARAGAYFPKKVQARSAVIPNPVVLTCEPLPAQVQREKTVISVGRFTQQKNQTLLLRSFALFAKRFSDYRLVIYGMDYGLKAQLEEEAKQLGIADRVSLCDPVENVQAQVRQSSLFALSSDYEGMPNALAEALSLGVPCVATDCRSGGPAFLLQEGKRGLLVPVGDVQAFADAMIRLVEDTQLWQHMAQAGRTLPQELSEEAFINKWDVYLRSVVEK